MTATRMLRTTARMLGLLFAISSVLLVASQALGGPVSLVVTHGSSMQPAYHEGDLVLVRKADYRPGDAVAYRSAQLRSIVLHRIVRVEGDRFVLKGDANGWLDADRPALSDLIGTPVARIPLLGKVLAVVRTPTGIVIIAAGAVLFAVVRMVVRRRRRGRAHARREGSGDILSSRSSRFNGRSVLVALGAGAVVSVTVSVAAFVLHASSGTATSASFEHTGTFGYSAPVTRGPVYERSTVGTGDPVYLKLAPLLDVRFSYRFRSVADHSVDVSGRLIAEVSDDTGWKRRFVISPSATSAGDRAELRGRLDAARIWRLIDEVQRLTGLQGGSYRLAIVPELHVTGAVGGGEIDERFSPRLPLQFDRLLLRVAQVAPNDTASSDEPPPDPLEPSQSGSVKIDSADSKIALGGVRLDATTARRIPIVASLAFILALAFAIRRGQADSTAQDEAARILRRHRRWIVPVAARSAFAASVVDVTSFESLMRLADRSDKMILHLADAQSAFVIEDEGTTYRYIPRTASAGILSLPARPIEEGTGAGESSG